jgi:hypothetical protein
MSRGQPRRIELTRPQYEFVSAPEPYPCFCGGFGAGKTAAVIVRAMSLKLRYPRQNIAMYYPTFDLVRRIGYPRFSEVFERYGVPYRIRKDDQLIELPSAGQIIFRTMDTPERIIGYEVADSLADELDTLKRDHAADVWTKILSRNRQKKPDGAANTAAVATTPEGYRYVYEAWKKDPQPGYRLIKASTMSNARNLPDGYIQSLRDRYPSNQLLAYLEGEFVNLTAGSVYPDFDRALNASRETIRDKEPLHIGMDFNVTKMAAVIHVLRDGEPHAVRELTDVFDTPAMAAMIKADYKDRGHPVMVYPDASGKNRKSQNASESDLSVLRQAGFSVFVNPANPLVKDRVLAMNGMLHAAGKRRYLVNPDSCPHLVEALERQAYDKNGEPDKSMGLDHVIDAAGYFIAYRYPVARRLAIVSPLRM